MTLDDNDQPLQSILHSACFSCRQERRLRVVAGGSDRAGSDCHCCYYSWRDIHDTLHQTASYY